MYQYIVDIEAGSLDEAQQVMQTMRDAVNLNRNQRTWARFEYVGSVDSSHVEMGDPSGMDLDAIFAKIEAGRT